jgi:hypothetical protein
MVVMCVRVLIGNVCVLVGGVEMDKLCCVCVCTCMRLLVVFIRGGSSGSVYLYMQIMVVVCMCWNSCSGKEGEYGGE